MQSSLGLETGKLRLTLDVHARPNRLPSIQILRAFAALLVVIGHALHEARAFDAHDRLASIAEMRFWTAGIDMFFILSGFIMMWTFGDRFGAPSAGLRFLKRRLIRIAPPYWIFTGLMVLAALVFSERLQTTVFTPSHALLSFLFIPHLAPHGGIHPILAVGWTLIYEMFFYLTFALVLCLPRRTGLCVLVLLYLVLHSLAVFTEVLPEALRLFFGNPVIFEFLFGVGFFFIQRNGQLTRIGFVTVIAFCVAAGIGAWLAGIWSQNRLWEFGLPALAILALFYFLLPEIKSDFWIFMVLIGEASYTLYLSHPFVLEAMKVPVAVVTTAANGQTVFVYVVSAIIAATWFSIVFYGRLEQKLTRWLSANIG